MDSLMIWMLLVKETKGTRMTPRFLPFTETGKMAVDARERGQSEVCFWMFSISGAFQTLT